MGGTVIETESEKLIRQGLRKGRSQGLRKGRSLGKKEGLSQGLSQGREEGLKEGLKEGKILGAIEILRGFHTEAEVKKIIMKKYTLTESDADKYLSP